MGFFSGALASYYYEHLDLSLTGHEAHLSVLQAQPGLGDTKNRIIFTRAYKKDRATRAMTIISCNMITSLTDSHPNLVYHKRNKPGHGCSIKG